MRRRDLRGQLRRCGFLRQRGMLRCGDLQPARTAELSLTPETLARLPDIRPHRPRVERDYAVCDLEQLPSMSHD